MYTDDELKEKIPRDEQAVIYVYGKYKNVVYFEALSFLKSDSEAEVFTQDFLINFIYGERGIRKFDPQRSSLNTYLRLRLRSELKTQFRRSEREKERQLEYSETNGNQEDEVAPEKFAVSEVVADMTLENAPDNLVLAEERAELVQRAIRKLSPDCQRVFQLFYVLGYSYAEIAKSLGKNEKTVSGGITKCRKKLKAILTKESSRLGYEFF